MNEHPIYPSGGGEGETNAWASYAKELRGELLTREWVAKAADYVRYSYDKFEEEIDEIIRLPTGATEDDCADIWCRLDGIYQHLMDRSNNCADKKEYKKLVRWAKRYIAKKSQEIWERENGWKYVKVGRNMYYPRKQGGSSAAARRI